MLRTFGKPVAFGILAFFAILGFYFGVTTLVSGWKFTQGQFADYGWFIVDLALGFAIQVGLYIYLRALAHKASAKMVAATGTTSATAMVACCAHYLVNVLPFLGVSAIATFVTQYQVELFWLGIVFNILGIVYMGYKIISFKKDHAQ